MPQRPSRITAEIDFDRHGKQVGYLRLPHSSNISAYGWIGIPIACVKNGEGPSVLCMAGNHGDEYEGQLALTRFIRTLAPEQVRGRIIVIPAANFPAAMAGARVSPIDDGNLNRRFPGDPDGPPTDMIAHYLSTELLPRCEAVVDLHSGGRTLHYLPSALTRMQSDAAAWARTRAALEAFEAPYAYVNTGPGENRTMLAVAQDLGLTAIGTELGGSGAVSRATLDIAWHGLQRFLHHLGALDPEERPAPTARTPSRVMQVKSAEHFVYAPAAGVFEPCFELGDTVSRGQLAGQVHFVDDPMREPVPVAFHGDGLVICKRTPAAVQRGDCVAHLAEDGLD